MIADKQHRVAGEERNQDEMFLRFLPAKDTELVQNHGFYLLKVMGAHNSRASFFVLNQGKTVDPMGFSCWNGSRVILHSA